MASQHNVHRTYFTYPNQSKTNTLGRIGGREGRMVRGGEILGRHIAKVKNNPAGVIPRPTQAAQSTQTEDYTTTVTI